MGHQERRGWRRERDRGGGSHGTVSCSSLLATSSRKLDGGRTKYDWLVLEIPWRVLSWLLSAFPLPFLQVCIELFERRTQRSKFFVECRHLAPVCSEFRHITTNAVLEIN